MEARQQRSGIDWLAFWILLSSWCSASGWILSALGGLNRMGYGISFGLFAGVLMVWGRALGVWGEAPGFWLMRFVRSRFVVPKIWLGLTVLVAIGGVLYHPNNYDYLTYRFPRVLHWWWDGEWTWIATVNERMNYSGPGFEWLMMPLFVFFKTDRLFFLINLISYCLLPRLVFVFFRQLGVSGRVAWWWMWVLPAGYCFVLQAASVGNDSFAAVYALAAIYYALRPSSTPTANLVLSMLAVALMTGAKAANLPLVLPWLIALYFNRSRLFLPLRPGLLLALLAVTVLVSFAPMGLLNIRFTGDYSGDPGNDGKMKLSNPVSGALGNGIQLVVASLAPPLLPKKVDLQPLLPVRLRDYVVHGFPRCRIGMGEMQMEEAAGAGLGLTLFAAVTLGLGLRRRRAWSGLHRPATWISAGAGVALTVYVVKIGSESGPRLIAAYYPFLIGGVLLLASLDGAVTRNRLYQVVGLLALLSAFPLVILNPARPLFPIQMVRGYLETAHAPASLLERYDQVYAVYGTRFEVFHPLLDFLPKDEREIGFIQTGNDPEASLWRRFGSHEIVDVSPGQTRDELLRRNVRVVVIGKDALDFNYHLTIEELAAHWSARVIAQKEIALLAQRGPETWYVLGL